MKKFFLPFLVTCSLLIQGCASHPLVPSTTQGKSFAVYPASITLTVNKTKEFTELLKDVSIFVVTAAATAGYVQIAPESGRKVADGNFGPALMHEMTIKFEQKFGMHKVADIKPLGSSKATGGILTEAEVKSDYQNITDYLVQFDSIPSTLAEGASHNYIFRYLATANVYDAKTGKRLDWAVCNGVQGAAPLADWFKDNGKMLDVVTQEVASKCADEIIHKLYKS